MKNQARMRKLGVTGVVVFGIMTSTLLFDSCKKDEPTPPTPPPAVVATYYFQYESASTWHNFETATPTLADTTIGTGCTILDIVSGDTNSVTVQFLFGTGYSAIDILSLDTAPVPLEPTTGADYPSLAIHLQLDSNHWEANDLYIYDCDVDSVVADGEWYTGKNAYIVYGRFASVHMDHDDPMEDSIAMGNGRFAIRVGEHY